MSIINLISQTKSEMVVSLFFRDFLKLVMSRKRPRYESSLFARSSSN